MDLEKSGTLAALVGRPNVGKSTLFNRLVERRQAIVHAESGSTRDRQYGQVLWNGHYFTLIDTGGYIEDASLFSEAIRRQVHVALQQSALILFMVDCKEGLHAWDSVFADVIRRLGKPTFILANKADTHTLGLEAGAFYTLGLGDKVFTLSSATGQGTGDLLDGIIKHLSVNTSIGVSVQEAIPKVAILGRPNVGKSSLLNALLGKERSIVSSTAGTTRDTLHAVYRRFGKALLFTDTAGIRKKNKVQDKLEFYSVIRALNALNQSDLCLYIIDAIRGLEAQDQHLIAQAEALRKGIILFVNKWDLVTKNNYTWQDYMANMHKRVTAANYSPILFGSVHEKQRLFALVEEIERVAKRRMQRVNTCLLYTSPSPRDRQKSRMPSSA